MLLAQVEWYETLEMLIDDLKSSGPSDQTTLPEQVGVASNGSTLPDTLFNLNKSLHRLKVKMQRQFASIGLESIMPQTITNEQNGIKVIENLGMTGKPEVITARN